MGRLPKQQKAAQTYAYKKAQKAPSKAKSKALPKYDPKVNEIEFITAEKIAVLNLPYKYIFWLGAKDGGKTRPVVTRMTGMMLNDKHAYGLALKRYKTNAAIRLHTAISNMALEMRMAGYDIPLLQKGINNTYLVTDERFKDLCQTIEYASLDDMDGIAGIEAPQLGRFAMVHVEEPVTKTDKEQPTKEEFWETIAVLESSVNRSNRRHALQFNVEPEYPTYHFTMNAWDDHPIITEAEEVFPENDFLNKCLGVKDWTTMNMEEIDEQWEDMKTSLETNHTSVVGVKSESKAFVRMTMFANPQWQSSELVYNSKLELTKEEQLDNFWNKIKFAIEQKDYSSLAIYLGLKKQKSADNKTYQTTLMETGDTLKKIKEEGWQVIGTAQGWDVDINRLFVDTPVVLARKVSLLEGVKLKMFVLPQQQFPAFGDGGGRNIPIYRDKMVEITSETQNMLIKLKGKATADNGDFLYIDDNQGQWLQYFMDDYTMIPGKAKKQGDWAIIHRQNWLNQAINSGFIMIDEKNEQLIREIKMSVLASGSDKRDESSTLNKNYDRINSLEYAIYPFRYWINEFLRSS